MMPKCNGRITAKYVGRACSKQELKLVWSGLIWCGQLNSTQGSGSGILRLSTLVDSVGFVLKTRGVLQGKFDLVQALWFGLI